ncbi:MAG TPA: 4Fe-4S binding protein, partial [Desulfuromonadales bacterium]|nr:4Fe-4S binding protein [Desulfuromonadales bacterium]
KGLPGCRLEQIEILGPTLKSLRPEKFQPAKSTDVNFGLPPVLLRPFRNAITAFPDPDEKLCDACGLCVRHCPAEAMQIDKGTLQIDDQRCIRCFCCQELCPKGALLTRQGLLLRLHQFLRRSSR